MGRDSPTVRPARSLLLGSALRQLIRVHRLLTHAPAGFPAWSVPLRASLVRAAAFTCFWSIISASTSGPCKLQILLDETNQHTENEWYIFGRKTDLPETLP